MARDRSSQAGGSSATLSSAARAASLAPEPMDIYLSEMRAHELLTREQEFELASELEGARRERSEVLAGWPQAVQDLLDRAGDDARVSELVRISKEDEQGLARTSQRLRRLAMSYGRTLDSSGLVQFAKAFAQVPWSDRCIRPFYAELRYRARQLEQITTELRQLCTVNAGMPLEYYEDHAPEDLLDFEWLDRAATKGALSSVALQRIRTPLQALHKRARVGLRNVGLSPGELRELYARMKVVEQRVRALRDRMVVSNLRLVVSIARRYVNRGVDMADLVQEGNIGLLRAVDGFDHRLGYKFSTYATWWIRQAVSRTLAERSRTIRLPVHVHEALVKLNRTTDRLVHRLGREPTIEELEEVTGLPEARVRQLYELVGEPLSLESPIAEDSEANLGQRVVDENALLPDEVAEQLRLKSALLGALSMLEPREAQVLRMRFGLDMNREHTLEEVGQQLGVTRERVRQLEGRALTKLRHPSRAAWLQTFIDP